MPKKIKWRDKIWDYWEEDQDYKSKQGRWFTSNLNDIRTKEFVNDTVEIIEEQQDIDIQSIEELNDTNFDCEHMAEDEVDYYHNNTRTKMNEIIRAVKQLDKKIKEKE